MEWRSDYRERKVTFDNTTLLTISEFGMLSHVSQSQRRCCRHEPASQLSSGLWRPTELMPIRLLSSTLWLGGRSGQSGVRGQQVRSGGSVRTSDQLAGRRKSHYIEDMEGFYGARQIMSRFVSKFLWEGHVGLFISRSYLCVA